MPDLALDVDETRLAGKIEHASASPLGSRFDLVADRFNLDAYRPYWANSRANIGAAGADVTTAGVGGRVYRHTRGTRYGQGDRIGGSCLGPAPGSIGPYARGGESGSGRSATTFAIGPISGPASASVIAGLMGNLALEGHLRLGELELARLGFGDTDLMIRAKDGGLEIDNRVQRFCEGKLAGRLALDMRSIEPRVALVQHAEEVESGHLLADLPWWSDRVSRRGEITADLAATGQNEDALQRSLACTLVIHFPHGVIKGINLERSIRETSARLSGTAAPKDLPMHTKFTDLRASSEVQNGILSNQDLVATADHLRITSAGTLDLV